MTFMEACKSKGGLVRVTGYKPAKVGVLTGLRKINRSWYGVIFFPEGEADYRLKWLRSVGESNEQETRV